LRFVGLEGGVGRGRDLLGGAGGRLRTLKKWAESLPVRGRDSRNGHGAKVQKQESCGYRALASWTRHRRPPAAGKNGRSSRSRGVETRRSAARGSGRGRLSPTWLPRCGRIVKITEAAGVGPRDVLPLTSPRRRRSSTSLVRDLNTTRAPRAEGEALVPAARPASSRRSSASGEYFRFTAEHPRPLYPDHSPRAGVRLARDCCGYHYEKRLSRGLRFEGLVATRSARRRAPATSNPEVSAWA